MVKVAIRKGMSGVLSLKQANDIKRFKGFDNELAANRYANKIKGQLYTQVDADNKDTIAYLRGHHLVNRTGYWVVVKPTQSELKKIKKIA